MKKFVHSRWFRECSVPLSPSESDTRAWYTTFSAPDSGKFSGQETPAKVMILQAVKADAGERGNVNASIGDFVLSGRSNESRKWAGGTADRITIVNERPNATYSELIRGVFEREGKSEMRKCEIIRRLKNRYPYFRTLRRLDSCVGQALRMGSAFISNSKFPGVWRYMRLEGKTSKMATRPEAFSSKVCERRRNRKPTDFYRAQWLKSPATAPAKMQRKSMTMDDRVGKEERKESAYSESDFDGSGSTISASLEVCSYESQELTKNLGEIMKEEEKSQVGKLKQQLREFHNNMLEETLSKITQENEECLQNMILKLNDAKNSTNDKNQLVDISDLAKQNKQILDEAINEIISQNEKCLEQLESSAVSHFKPARTDALTVLRQKSSSHPITVSSCQATPDHVMPTSVVTVTPGTCSASVSTSFSQPIISNGKGSSIRSHYPLSETRCSHRQHNHVRFGRRIVPRLKSLSFDLSAIESEAEVSSEYSSRKRSLSAGCATKVSTATSSLNVGEQFSENSSSDLLISKVTSIQTSSNAEMFRSSDKELFSTPEVVSTTHKDSMDDTFAKFAKRNSELDNIIAMIDPTLVSKHGRKYEEAKSILAQEVKTEKPNPRVVDDRKYFRRSEEASPENISNSESVRAECEANINRMGCRDITDWSSPATSMTESAKHSTKQGSRISSCSTRKLQDIKKKERNYSSSLTPKISFADPRSSVSRAVFSYRYKPPYEWGYGGMPTNASACSNTIVCRPSMLVNPNATEYLVYSAVRPNGSQPTNPAAVCANASRSVCVSGIVPNNFQCRIQGASIFGISVLKKNLQGHQNIYASKR